MDIELRKVTKEITIKAILLSTRIDENVISLTYKKVAEHDEGTDDYGEPTSVELIKNSETGLWYLDKKIVDVSSLTQAVDGIFANIFEDEKQ